MTSQAYPAVNDVAISWSEIAITITPDGGSIIDQEDCAGIKWSRKVEVGEQRGTSGGRVMKRTTGQGSQEASITLYRSGWRKLLQGLMANAPTRGNQLLISRVSFDIMVQHTPVGDEEIYTTKIKGCRFLGDADDMKEGNDPDKIEITLSPIEIANIVEGKEVVLL